MKVIHVVQCYHPAVGGVEGLVKNLSEQLVSRHQDEVTVFTSNAPKPEDFYRAKGQALPSGVENINGVQVHRFKAFNGLQGLRGLLASGAGKLRLPYNDWLRTIQNGPLMVGVSQAIADSGADVVFATSFPFLHIQYALAGAKRAQIPLVLLGAIHASDKWNYDRQMMYTAIRKADAYIALTPFERDYLVQRDISPDKIRVIGAGVHAERFAEANGRAIRERHGWGERPVVGALARQTESKRLDVLIRAMVRVWEKYPHAHLLLAGGRTSYTPKLKQMVDDLESSQRDQVTIINDFTDSEKPNLLAACDILAHPSGKESFGIVFLEAWACGKPIIGARVGAVASVIDEGRDGLMAEYLDAADLARAILELLDAPARRLRMGEAGREKVRENYTWEIVTDRLREVYVEVISRRG
jgi:glycosyltransferase involved in cell wall biosynthesis